jgi:Mg-chelatase subunit ChlD
MSCPDELELFLLREGVSQARAEGEGLSPEREKEVADHVASCADCQATLAELEALGKALAEPEPMAEGHKAAFAAEVIRRIDAQEPKPAASVGGSRLWTFGVPLAAAACCGLLLLVIVPTLMVSSNSAEQDIVATAQPIQHSLNSSSPNRALAEESESSADEGYAPSPSEMPAAASAGEGQMGRLAAKRSDNRFGIKGPGQLQQRAERDRTGSNDLDGLLNQAVGGGGDGRGSGRPQALPAPRRPAGLSNDPLGGLELSPERAAPSQPPASPPPVSPSKASAVPGGPQGGRFGNSGGWAPPSDATLGAVQPPRPTAIDSNGRFATTYRPGRGHLARFETALFRSNQVPEPALELVADTGRGSGPEVAAPTEQALALDIRTGMARLDPAGGPVHLALTLRSTASEPASRPDVAVHLVMDTSGSMMGEAIAQAQQAARQLVGMLEPRDRFSLVSYSTGAEVVTDEGPVGPRRAQILSQIDRLRATGGTNLEAGLRLGYAQAQSSRSREDSVQLVIVLSDGQPNQGITDPMTLSEMSAAAFQGGVETTTIGVGDSYEPLVMSTLAEYGAGGYYYLPDASAIEQVLRAELDVRTQPVARGVELRVRLGDGVELLEAYGSRRLNQAEAQRVRQTEVAIDHQEAHRSDITRDRDEDREGGMRFFIPGFARDDQHTILLRLRAPEGISAAELLLAEVELRYKDRVLLSNQGDERRVVVPYAENRAAALTTLEGDVRRAVYSFRTGESLVAVSSRLARGQQPEALALLYERAELLHRAGDELNDPFLRAEAGRLDSFRGALLGQAMSNQLMMGALLQRAGSGRMR